MVRIEYVLTLRCVYQFSAPIIFVTVGVVDGDRGVQLFIGELLELGEKFTIGHCSNLLRLNELGHCLEAEGCGVLVTFTVLTFVIIGVRIYLVDEVIEIVHVLDFITLEDGVLDHVHDVIVTLDVFGIGVIDVGVMSVFQVIEIVEENGGFGSVHETNIHRIGGRRGLW
jgi:hypothetical protein